MNPINADDLRFRIVTDPDASFEECNGEARPLTEAEYADTEYFDDNGTRAIPYAEYLAYYGNPDRHVYLGVILEARCPLCTHWHEVGSLWHIDLMDDDPALRHARINGAPVPYTVAATEPLGYLGDVARDLALAFRLSRT